MPEVRTLLVTGGTGFVGSHVIDALLEAGHHVRCLIRSSSRLRWLEGKSVETVEADLRGDDLATAVSGVDAVIHCAGLTRGSRAELYDANVIGTRNLLRACVQADRPPRFVFCSSQAAAGPATPGRPRRLDDTPAPNSDYGRSKLAAEAAVREHAPSLSAMILRPGAVYGPRDADTLPFFEMAARGLVVKPGVRKRLVQIVHAADVAAALLLGAEHAAPQVRTYFVAHPRVLSWRELAAEMGRALGRKPLVLPLPSPVFRLAGLLSQAAGSARHAGALDRRRAADLLEPAWTCEVEPTITELGWNPRFDVDAGLRDTVAWYREEGWL